MTKTLALAAAATLALAAGAAHADRGGVSWSVGVSVPGVTTVVGNAPGAYAPPAVYYAPPAGYYAPPAAAYYPPAPVYVPPRVAYAPPPAAYYGPPRAVYGPQLVLPPVARVAVPWRHHHHGWGPGPVAYAPPVVYAPRPYYDRHWR